VLVGSFTLPTNSFSQNKAEHQEALKTLKKEIKKLQKNLQKKLKKQSKATAQLNAAEKKIATTTKILKSTIRQLKEKSKELNQLRLEQIQLDTDKALQKQAIAQQIKSAYINGKQEYLKLLLNQEDPEELLEPKKLPSYKILLRN
jgi:septal ring factor EnvC (AmiA/AmiB activator)